MATKHEYAPYYWKHNKAADKFYNSGFFIALFFTSLVFGIASLVISIVEFVSHGPSPVAISLSIFVMTIIIIAFVVFRFGEPERFNNGDKLIHNQYKALDSTSKKKLRPLAKAYGQGKMNGDENRKFALLVQEKFKLVKDSPAQNKYLSALDMELATVKEEKEIQSIIKKSQEDIDNIMKGFK